MCAKLGLRIDKLRVQLPLLACLCYACMALFQILFDEIFPLFAKTDPPVGLGFDSEQIGYSLAISGLALFAFTTLCVPTLIRRFGKFGVMKTSLWMQLPVYLFFPLNHHLVSVGRCVCGGE